MQKKFSKKLKRILVCLLLAGGLFLFCYFENNAITVSDFEIRSKDIPPDFDGCVIVQISDLHNKLFGENQHRLISKLEKQNPDLIVVTGDLVDSNHTDVEKALLFIDEAVKLAPVYFVTGNHDNWLSEENTGQLYEGLEKAGVTVLDDEFHKLSMGNDEECIYLMGVDDGTLATKSALQDTLSAMMEETGESEGEEDSAFRILLAHEPQLMPVYAEYDIDLVLSGHAHGGQFRIPFIGGFVAPDQGFLPKYTKGLYVENDTSMIVSCGLGNSVIPQRLLNRPELVTITLIHE